MDTLIAISPSIGLFSRPVIVFLLLLGLSLGIRRAPPAAEAGVALWFAIAVPLLGWFLLATWIGQTELYQLFPPARLLATLAVPLVWLALLTRSRRFMAVLAAIPPAWLIALQLYRVLGFVFLVQWAAGRVPGAFALPAGIGDIATGGLAVPVACWAAWRWPHWRLAGYAWNVLGLADFAIALSIATFVAPTGLRYPLIMIPTFSVPLAIVLHVLSLWQLARSEESSVVSYQLSARPVP